MKITENAKQVIETAFQENGFDMVGFSLEKDEASQGTAISLALVKEAADQRTISIDGLKIAVSKSDEAMLEDVTLDAEDGVLTLHSDGCCFENESCSGEEGCACGR